jgi:hypothetical protein
MLRNPLLRKRYAKLHIDDIIHASLDSVSTNPSVKGALERLLTYVYSRTNLLSPMPLGGQASWAKASYFLKGLVALARNRRYWLREVDDWEPTGNCSLRQFGSLARHLLATHFVPNFMDLVWFIDPSQEARQKQQWFRCLGLGFGIRGANIPLKLTKKMAHFFLHAPDHYTVEEAFRCGQILGFGGKPSLVQAVNSTRLGSNFEHETYWSRVIEFFAHNAELVTEHVGPFVEYLRFRKLSFKLEPPLPEKRKTVLQLLEKVSKWRHPITGVSHSANLRWDRLGIGGLEFNEEKHRNPLTWTIRELLDSNELIMEGRAMRHCVGSYAGRCVKQGSSIWSMSRYSCLGQEHVLTIEVNPRDRTIVQAKGKRNSPPSSEARRIMLRWAAQEGLKIAENV